MGYSWDEVHDEAEKLEHRISELLNHPTHDPHGVLFQQKMALYLRKRHFEEPTKVLLEDKEEILGFAIAKQVFLV